MRGFLRLHIRGAMGTIPAIVSWRLRWKGSARSAPPPAAPPAAGGRNEAGESQHVAGGFGLGLKP